MQHSKATSQSFAPTHLCLVSPQRLGLCGAYNYLDCAASYQINPTGPKSFRVTETGKVYTIGDKDAPHLKLKIVVVNTQYVGYADDNGKFEIDNVPAGSYKVRVWSGDNWVQREDETVNVGAKGKTDVNPKIPAAAFAPAAKK